MEKEFTPLESSAIYGGQNINKASIPNRKGGVKAPSFLTGFTLKRIQFLKKDYSQGFIADVGYKAVNYQRGYLESRLKILSRHRQQDHYIHAGVIATMADHTAGYAAFSLVPEDHRILTIEFKINFLQPAYGNALVCKSRILRGGGQILVGESEVFDRRGDKEELVAKAIVTLRSIHQSKIKPVPHLKD